MSELLKKDTTIKVLSVFFAVILWFVVNPVTTKTISVPLTVRGEDTLKDKSILLKDKNYDRTIDIVIRGNEEKIKSVNGYDFEAILDFSKINSPDDKVLVIDGPRYIGKEDGIIIQKVLQESVEVDLERIEKNSLPVNIKSSGNIKSGYKMIALTAIPDTITLQGPDSLIKTASEIRTVVNVNNIDRDTILKKQICKVYDGEGKEIAALSRNLTVDVKVQVAKEVAVTLVVKGKPASDYIDGQRKVSPERVLITGPADVISKISELKTEPVNIENSSKTIETVSMIILPSGVKLVDIPREVSVSVVIEPLAEKKFVITRDMINLTNLNAGTDNSLSYEIKTESIEVVLKGPRIKLGDVSIDDMVPSINVDGLGEGSHKVPLTVNLPADFKLDKEYFVEINVQKSQTSE